MPFPRRPYEDRLWEKVKVHPLGCWIWQGALSTGGYGKIGVPGGRGSDYAHRAAYEVTFGPIPQGLQIDHLCRNRKCINPAHLEPVTLRENLLRGDGFAGRQARQTHCKRGHPLTGDNLRPSGLKQGLRQCRQCGINRRRARRGDSVQTL